jgi:phosphoglycerate kinase
MAVPRLEDLAELDAAKVLLRLDLNVPVADGVVQDTTRIDAALTTLRWLLERVPLVAACSHLGKPRGEVRPELSLAPVAVALEQALGRPVRFVPGCVGEVVTEALATAAPGTVLLLENLRFDPGEKANDEGFARALAAPFTHYVNDAFGTAHRAHASVAGIPALLGAGRKAVGRLMEAELDALGGLLSRSDRPFVAVVGGAKISTKTEPLEALLERVDALAIGGGMANTFLLAQGHEVGGSLVEAEMVDTAREVMARAAARGVELIMPADVVVTDSLDAPTDTRVVEATAVPPDRLIVDIGPRTIARCTEAVVAAQRVFWNGPMGVFEKPDFAAGTMAVAEALSRCAGFTVVGGGESVMAVHRAGVADRVSHVSTGGGASLKLIAGGPLPAVDALEG